MTAAPCWRLSWKADPAGAALADRHYNRHKPGARQFAPPGRTLVLVTDDERSVWITVWQDHVDHAWPGAWVNSLFRREGGELLASEMIRQAVAHTRWKWWPAVPELGMVTFIDPAKVRRKRDPGRCYLRAGFRHAGTTKDRGLLVLQGWPYGCVPKDFSMRTGRSKRFRQHRVEGDQFPLGYRYMWNGGCDAHAQDART